MGAPGYSPADPVSIAAAFEAAEAESEANVDDPLQACGPEENWTETGLIDESTGEPVPNIPYKIYDRDTKKVVASGTLDENGLSPRHCIPLEHTSLFVMYGTDDAIDEAMAEMERLQKEHALATNAKADWRGIPAGLDEAGFNAAYDQKTIDNGGRFEKPSVSLLEGAGYGAIMVYDYVSSGFDSGHMIEELYEDDRARSFDEYQLVTGAREATRGESFGGGLGQGVTFGFGEEFMAWFESSITGRDYDTAVAERRQIQRAQKISHSGYYLGGEITGGVATIFIPVAGAAGKAAQGATTGAKLVSSATAAAKTGAALGALSGAGHDEGGVVDRLDGAAWGAATGGVAGALLGGAGVLIARGASKTRIWAKAKFSARATPKKAPFHRKTLDEKWYDPKTGDLRWPPNDGFAKTPINDVLKPGTQIDRYSGRVGLDDTGSFVSPRGASYQSRALPYEESMQKYAVYEVVKPLPVKSGNAAAWFDEAGGAMQYQTEKGVSDLIKEGFLKQIK